MFIVANNVRMKSSAEAAVYVKCRSTVQLLPKVKSLPHFFSVFQWDDCSNFSWIERLCTKILLSFCRTKKFSPQRLKELL